jgi:hypothetical protein
MKNKRFFYFGILALLAIVTLGFTACNNDTSGDDEPESPIGIWTGTWTGRTSSSIELKITSDEYDFYGMGTRDEGTWYKSGDRLIFTSTMGTGELGWAKITGNKMAFNVTLPLFLMLFNCPGGQLTKTGSE